MRLRCGDASQVEPAIDGLDAIRQQPQANLRRRAVMRDTQRGALGIRDEHGVAGLGLTAIQHVAGKNPGMAASDAVGRFSIHSDCVQISVYWASASARAARCGPPWKDESRTAASWC